MDALLAGSVKEGGVLVTRMKASRTDGRSSGTSGGRYVGRLVPEAMAGGPIAVLRDGDITDSDFAERRVSKELTDDQIKQRMMS